MFEDFLKETLEVIFEHVNGRGPNISCVLTGADQGFRHTPSAIAESDTDPPESR
jgi:hypothetical protein